MDSTGGWAPGSSGRPNSILGPVLAALLILVVLMPSTASPEAAPETRTTTSPTVPARAPVATLVRLDVTSTHDEMARLTVEEPRGAQSWVGGLPMLDNLGHPIVVTLSEGQRVRVSATLPYDAHPDTEVTCTISDRDGTNVLLTRSATGPGATVDCAWAARPIVWV